MIVIDAKQRWENRQHADKRAWVQNVNSRLKTTVVIGDLHMLVNIPTDIFNKKSCIFSNLWQIVSVECVKKLKSTVQHSYLYEITNIYCAKFVYEITNIVHRTFSIRPRQSLRGPKVSLAGRRMEIRAKLAMFDMANRPSRTMIGSMKLQ